MKGHVQYDSASERLSQDRNSVSTFLRSAIQNGNFLTGGNNRSRQEVEQHRDLAVPWKKRTWDRFPTVWSQLRSHIWEMEVMTTAWLSSTQECHGSQIEEWPKRGDGFSSVSVEFFGRFRSLPVPPVVMHLSQDNLGCTVAYMPCPPRTWSLGTSDPCQGLGEALPGPGSGPGP